MNIIYQLSTVIRIFDIIAYVVPKELPEVIGIDEFKGKAGEEKYLTKKSLTGFFATTLDKEPKKF